MAILWLRTEYKENETRAALTPEHAKYLIDKGHNVIVEKSAARIFKNSEYEQSGCGVAKADEWRYAPENAIILGLKKIPDDNFPLIHKHIYFAHAYNNKRIFTEKLDSLNLFKRFTEGNGLHYDLEFLTDENSRRICAFGYYAGIVGAYFSLCLWYEKHYQRKEMFDYSQQSNNELYFYNKVDNYCQYKKPSVLVIGATGRCGSGVVEILKRHNIPYVAWGRAETQNAACMKSVMNFDILINCISASEETNDILTHKDLINNRKLSVIGDIGCETSDNNPIKIYKGTTSYENISHRIPSSSGIIDVIAIDNLPSFFSRESSYYFSSKLMPSILDLLEGKQIFPWINANSIFKNHCSYLTT